MAVLFCDMYTYLCFIIIFNHVCNYMSFLMIAFRPEWSTRFFSIVSVIDIYSPVVKLAYQYFVYGNIDEANYLLLFFLSSSASGVLSILTHYTQFTWSCTLRGKIIICKIVGSS